jgi:glycosyltransferase involved in cell wall biosynthesis
MPGSQRIALVTDEILGLTLSSGAATANTFLSFALADLGHQVDVFYAAPIGPEGLAETWRGEYNERDIGIRPVEAFPHRVSPKTATVTCAVHEALRHDPPDVVIADDRYGSCYASVRTRSLGLGFPDTLFVVYCHGTTAWISEAHRKIRRWPAAFEVEALERAAIELADVIVSPSAYMVDWMRGRGWRLPRAVVAPLLTRSAVDRTAAREPVKAVPIRRVAFFGRLEERKGLRPFIDAVNAMGAHQLAGLELLFVGKETPSWTSDRVRAALSPPVQASLAALRFETKLDQPDALALLERPGTLAVMPSLLDNSPMVIYECLERGIPFLASSAGGGPELVVEDDRQRVFAEPTAEALQHRLAALLSSGEGSASARPAFDAERVLAAWESAIASSPTRGNRPVPTGTVSAVVRRRGGPQELDRCLRALREQTRAPDQVVVVEAESDAGAATGDFLFLLDDVDQPEPDCLETFLRAQGASDADVVTCAFRSSDGDLVSFFLGDARELGLIGNHHGLAGIYRRAIVDLERTAQESAWRLLASLALARRHIVSIPQPLVRSPRLAENVATAPGDALAVVDAFERAGTPQLRGLPTLAASFVAQISTSSVSPPLGQRVRSILASEGPGGLVRRVTRRVRRSRDRSFAQSMLS